jgi:hypothetical protein
MDSLGGLRNSAVHAVLVRRTSGVRRNGDKRVCSHSRTSGAGQEGSGLMPGTGTCATGRKQKQKQETDERQAPHRPLLWLPCCDEKGTGDNFLARCKLMYFTVARSYFQQKQHQLRMQDAASPAPVSRRQPLCEPMLSRAASDAIKPRLVKPSTALCTSHQTSISRTRRWIESGDTASEGGSRVHPVLAPRERLGAPPGRTVCC